MESLDQDKVGLTSYSEIDEETTSRWTGLTTLIRSNAKLFAVKPLLVLYMMSYAVTMSVNTQFWVDRTCRVNLNFSDAVCDDLASEANTRENDEVQKQVNYYQLYSNYMAEIPATLVSLYLGPVSDSGRKPILLVPFFGHIVSGIAMILNCIYTHWDARYLWLAQLYVFCGGYNLLSIAMYGYIGDVSSVKQRTAIIAVLGALGFIMMPLADFCGGQIYKAGGFLPVYITSLVFVLLGILYILVIPESVTSRSVGVVNTGLDTEKDPDSTSPDPDFQDSNCVSPCSRLWSSFMRTNKLLLHSFKYICSPRDHGERGVIFGLVTLSFIGGFRSRSTNGVLYTQKKFGWSVTDYTNFQSFFTVHLAIKGFLVMPFLCYYLQVHDCMVAILGGISSIEEYLVWAFATKGWHMYFGSALSALSGSRGSPQTSLLTKCVPPEHLGKIFSIFGAFQTALGLAMAYVNTLVYNATLDTFLGASYCLSAGFEGVNIIGMLLVWMYVHRVERRWGPLGETQ